MEDYAAKMALKPDAALWQYVADHAQYREEAVLAALDELRRRGQPAPDDAALRPQLEAVVQQNQATAAAKEAADAQETELPRLYSPAGIVVMSATISVVAGAVLLAINLRRLKRSSAIPALIGFVLAYLVGEALVLKWLSSQHLLTPTTGFLIDLPLILALVWWFWPRYVRTYQFQPRNWLLPLGGCLLLKFGLLYLLMSNPTTKHLIEQQMNELRQVPTP